MTGNERHLEPFFVSTCGDRIRRTHQFGYDGPSVTLLTVVSDQLYQAAKGY